MIKEYVTSQHLTQIAETIQTYVDYKYKELESKIDYIEVSYEELVTLRKEARLQPGCFYCIYDYATTTSSPDTQSAGHNFPIVVLATSTHTLSEEAKAIQHWGDEYFNNSNLEAWKIWYCLDNDTDKFAWAGATKPVLFFNCHYDTDTQGSGMSVFKRDESLDIEESGITYYGYTFVRKGGPHVFYEDSKLWYTEEFPEITDDNMPHTFYQFSGEKMVPINMDSRFYEGEESIGKGVIYRMIDEFGNDCPYDFKNIKFKNPLDTTDENYYFTFSDTSDGEIKDATISQIEKDVPGKCSNNVIGYYLSVSGDMCVYPYDIPKNIFKNGDFYFVNNTLGNNCYNNLFVSYYCLNNTFGNGCYHNTFDGTCVGNTLGNNCYDNKFESARYNTLGDNCYSNKLVSGEYNTLGDYCALNVFNTFSADNILGNYCQGNTFGVACGYNTFGSHCFYNMLGSYFSDNTFGSSSSYNTFAWKRSADDASTALNYMINCYFPAGYSYNELIHYKSANDDSATALQNVHFGRGLHGTRDSMNTITIGSQTSADYETKVAKNSAGEIKIYCEADLIS
jgi:hypothetical protein